MSLWLVKAHAVSGLTLASKLTLTRYTDLKWLLIISGQMGGSGWEGELDSLLFKLLHDLGVDSLIQGEKIPVGRRMVPVDKNNVQ